MKFLVSLFLLFLFRLTFGQPGEPIRLWPGEAPNEPSPNWPGPEGSTKENNNGCGIFRNETCYNLHNVSKPTITPYLVNNGTGAAIIIAPGGGYSILAINLEGEDIARMYNRLGVSAFLLKYRVPARPPVPGMPVWFAPLQDAQRAVGIVRYGAVEGRWNVYINSSRIGFTGFSAGGHLTGHISTAWRKRIYPRVDAADDASCKPDFSIFMYPWMLLPGNKAAAWGEAYALAQEFSGDAVASDHPISMFIHNADDPTAPVQGSKVYHGKLMAVNAGEPVLHVFNRGGHGFGLCQGRAFAEACDWPKTVQRYLQNFGLSPGWPAGTVAELHDMYTQNCDA